MPESIEAEEVHFFHGLVRGPLLESHAVGSHENSGAIITKAAVHENPLPWLAAKQRQKLNHLLVRRRRPATDGDVYKAHAERFSMLALPRDFFLVFTAKIDNRGDAQQFQFRKARFFGLRAAREGISDFPGIGNSSDAKFLPEGGLRGGRSGRGGSGLRENAKRKNQKESERWKSALHIQ